jgi:hypothetical protein
MPHPSARTKSKNLKLTFTISFRYFKKLLEKADLSSPHDQVLFNKFANLFASSVSDLSDLAQFGLTDSKLSEIISDWGYITTDISLRHTPELTVINNNTSDISFTVTTKSVLDAPDDEADEAIISSIKEHILQPQDYAKREDYAYVSCFIGYADFRHALEDLHLYDAVTIKRTLRYFARQINASNISYPLFYEDWAKEMAQVSHDSLTFIEIEPYSTTITSSYISFIAKYSI